MFFFNWFGKLFNYFGFYRRTIKIVFLGLDNAGKTTLLNLLRNSNITQPLPTLHPYSQELRMNGINFTTYDLGGHSQVRQVWKEYFPAVDALIYFIDASDTKRLAESKHELDSILRDEYLINCPILILGNKIDKHGAISHQNMENYFELEAKNKKDLKLFMCSLFIEKGIHDAFLW